MAIRHMHHPSCPVVPCICPPMASKPKGDYADYVEGFLDD